ncbi:hypothetical protein DIT71_03025 [Marinobacter vulgaris]|uniref:Uncharacterized protein n=1 Tax=Marinobacter vulgaris TaxID=1928331 RepID=A0A2V3ZQJ3_9GAMM|nr:DUF6502 family protein [Marinobacter vulgaris]PXX93785.1 hypothetical protein DIT71_03025 [Marinobacter vulgaris]TSJ72196.1 hypothetical protein FPC41_00250 [Marinobacter vulgaris]
MKKSETNPLHRALYRILRPMARLLLRNGIPFAEFAELVRRAYVDAALEDFSNNRKKPTDSSAAVMTGLTRKEVKRQREILAGEHAGGLDARHENRASRVVSGWVHDSAFQTSDGEPAELPFDGPLSFSELVKRYSGDMTPRAVLEELVRVGVVATDGSGKLTLRQRAYVPAGDSEEMLQIFGKDVSDLIATIDHNLVGSGENSQPLFQRTLVYNNIPPDVIVRWRQYAAEQSQSMLEQLDRWLGPHDRDIASQGEGGARGEAVRTGVGIFYFEDPVQPEIHGDQK